MNLTRMSRLLPVLALAIAGWSMPSSAAVNVFFSAGSGCGGSSSASFTPGGSPVQVSLCMTTTAPTATCGHTILLQSAVGESGRFTVVDPFVLGGNYSEPNSVSTPVPLAINNPATVVDFGGTSNGSVVASANQVLATFNLSPSASATNNSYVISLAPVSIVAVDSDGTCGQTTVPTEQSISASFTLNKNLAPVFTSPITATFANNAANSFTFVAPGATSFSISGTFPTGMSVASLNTMTGVLSGTPSVATTPQNFMVNVTATGPNGSAMQTFTIVVDGKASQTISFNTPPQNQPFNPTPIALSATASSGLPVTFASGSPAICSISGSNLTMLTIGECIINATQAGNASYDLATKQHKFGISPTAPGAPTIGAATAGNAQATVAFTAPSSTGGAAITSYTLNCGGSTTNGTTSPITITGLMNGTTYSCSVTATNSFGTGPASGTVMVTPSAGVMAALIGVQSRKTHGAAGTFDVPIDFSIAPTGLVSVEPRNISTGHVIVFQMNAAITSPGTATATDVGSGMAIGTIQSVTQSGNEVLVTITGIPNIRRVTVALNGVNGINVSATMGFLAGDVNGSRVVNGTDKVAFAARTGQFTDALNFKFDVNLSGAINGTDKLIGATGTILP